MASVASRDLRNHTAAVLKRVAEGEHVTITVRGEEVAEIVPARKDVPRRWIPREELLEILAESRADPTWGADIARLTDDTTDDLPPLR